MKRIQVADNFFLDEFVDPWTYFNTDDHGRSLLDERLFEIAQLLRDLYGKPIGINNWWHYYKWHEEFKSCNEIISDIENNTILSWGGARHTVYKWSGLRTDRSGVGAPQSAHRPLVDNQCKAIDPKGPGKTLFKIVEDNAKRFYDLGVRRLEHYSITPGWLHLDTLLRFTQPNSIRVVDRTSHVKTIRWD